MKTLTITACLLLVALASAQRFSTTPKYIIPAGGPNVNINDPNVNINDPNVNINDPNYAQPANGIGGPFSSYGSPNGVDQNGVYVGQGNQYVPAAAGAGGLSNSAENGGANTMETSVDEMDGGSDGGSVLNLDTDGDSEASMKQGVNTTALGVVLTIIVVLAIFGVVAVILIRQRRLNGSE